MTLGQKLVELRKSKGLTQEELAKILNVSRGAVSMWEIDQRVPDRLVLGKIADLFEVSIDYLLGRTNDPRTLKDKVFDPTYEPTEMDLEELLKTAKIRFMGEPMAQNDREKLLQIARIIWEERRKIKEELGK
ncbi:MAG: helix-turn-helix domain-containing protein [Moorellaceae bacterium]